MSKERGLLADEAHELRTLVAAIISETQTALARERTAGEYRESLELTLETAQQMRKLLESLLHLAHGESGPARRECTDIGTIARACVRRFAALAAQHQVRVEGEFTAAMVYADPEALDKLVTNLVSNAIYYNKAGGEVRVRTHRDGEHAVLSVADTGIGIASCELPELFNRFFRADSGARAAGHTGLGLAICKAIVDAECGTIAVESTPGAGSTFTVRLPDTLS